MRSKVTEALPTPTYFSIKSKLTILCNSISMVCVWCAGLFKVNKSQNRNFNNASNQKNQFFIILDAVPVKV